MDFVKYAEGNMAISARTRTIVFVTLVIGALGLTGCQSKSDTGPSSPTTSSEAVQPSSPDLPQNTSPGQIDGSATAIVTGKSTLIQCTISSYISDGTPYCYTQFSVTNHGSVPLTIDTFVFLEASGKIYQGFESDSGGVPTSSLDKFQEVLNPEVPVDHVTIFTVPNGVHFSKIFFSWTSNIADSVASFDLDYSVNASS